MFLILLALCVLAVSAAGLGLLAFARPTPATTRLADLSGPLGAACGCALGMAGLFTDSWTDSLLWTQAWGLPVGSLSLGLDALSRVFLLPVFGLGFVCACAGGISLRHTRASEHNLAAHWLFYLLLVLGMAVVMMAHDAVLFLLAWEVMSLSPFFLIDFNDSDRNVRDASWVYLVAAHLGAVLLLAFFGLLWQNAGDTAFAVLPLREGPAVPLASVLFVLSLLGFGAKAGIAPMHVWLPEAHPAAPSHISALLSGAMINAGLYGIIRSCEFVAPLSAAPAWWGWLALFLGLGTALMGILKALAQSNLKRLLAYSSVENMGLMLMGVGAWLIGSHSGNSWIGTLGLAGAMFHMLNHSAFKGLLFLTAGEVLHATGTVRMDLLGGLQQRMPLVGAAFGIGAVSIACFPPFNGFAGEFVLALSLLDGSSLPGVEQQLGLLMALVVLGLVSGLAAATYAKAYGITFLGAPRSRCVEEAHRPRPRDLWPLAIPAFLCVAGGLAYGHCFRWLISTVNAPLPDPAAGQQVMLRVADMLGTVSLVGMVLLALVAALWLLRKACIAGRLRREETWGCGYRYGTARVQYTDASFSEPLGRLFGGAMGLKVHQELDGRYFPGKASVAISAPDRLRTGLFTPLFEGVEKLCNMCKILQHGKIHLYILYILATLVALLAWGLHA